MRSLRRRAASPNGEVRAVSQEPFQAIGRRISSLPIARLLCQDLFEEKGDAVLRTCLGPRHLRDERS